MSKANYVDNEKLHNAIVEWLDKRKEDPEARMTDYIGHSIQLIADGLSYAYNFKNYTQTWKEEMVGDAIINCVKYLSNYDPVKYNNPHAYITMCCYSAMQQRIKKEKLQQVTKYKFFTENFDVEADEFDAEMSEDFMSDMMNRISDFEKKKKERKLKKQEQKQESGLDI